MSRAHDQETLAFYDREASAYAARRQAKIGARLAEFLGRLKPGARILELGCGGGQDAQVMLAAGYNVEPTDGSAALAAEAEQRLGRPVKVMRFDQLDAVRRYDAVWANACLLHVPEEALVDVLRGVWTGLVVGGVFFASFKSGTGGDRDALCRYYNFIGEAALETACRAAGKWSELTIDRAPGGGYDGVERTWLFCLATKG
jgi:2-polyprenyl-3-methyl-5-hydroxy-6-metoxy-1,4-benzoquinol methylase